NRLGSNSLPELLVFGARAGRAAAEYAAAAAPGSGRALLAQGRDEERRLQLELDRRTDGGERIADIRAEMHSTLELAAGIYRDRTTLADAVGKLAELRERFAKAALDDHTSTFNTELLAMLELSSMLDVAQTILASALNREESRGAHQR